MWFRNAWCFITAYRQQSVWSEHACGVQLIANGNVLLKICKILNPAVTLNVQKFSPSITAGFSAFFSVLLLLFLHRDLIWPQKASEMQRERGNQGLGAQSADSLSKILQFSLTYPYPYLTFLPIWSVLPHRQPICLCLLLFQTRLVVMKNTFMSGWSSAWVF